MNRIDAKTYLSNLTVPGAAVRYYLKPANTTNISFEQLCSKVASVSGLPLSTVKYVLESCNQKLVDLLVKNCRVHTGAYVASLGIGGSLASMTDQPNKINNPVHAVMTPEGDIVDALKAIEVINTTITVMALLNEVQEDGCLELSKLTTANADVVINGANLKIDTTKTDEGVWLADRTTGSLVKAATISENGSARLIVKFATLPTDGTYDLVVATRNCEEGMDVVVVKKMVTVEAAA